MISEIFNNFFYQPIFSTLIFIYHNFAFKDFGLAVIILTLIIRLILTPLMWKGAKDQSVLQKIQPQLKKIQNEFKEDKEKQMKEILALYQKYKFNPFSGFLILLIQLPILFALFKIFTSGLKETVFDNFYFLGLIDLKKPNQILVFLAALCQYFQGKISLPKTESLNISFNFNQIMVWLGPFLTLMVLMNLPSALSLYWFISSLVSIGQQIYINKKLRLEKNEGSFDSKN